MAQIGRWQPLQRQLAIPQWRLRADRRVLAACQHPDPPQQPQTVQMVLEPVRAEPGKWSMQQKAIDNFWQSFGAYNLSRENDEDEVSKEQARAWSKTGSPAATSRSPNIDSATRPNPSKG